MTARQRRIAAVGAVVAVLLAACSGGGGVAPTSPASVTTPPASITTTSRPTLSAGVPSVRDPLNFSSALLAAPCEGITEPQRQALSQKGIMVRPGERRETAAVPTCVFGSFAFEQKGELTIELAYKDYEGISPLYDSHAKGYSPEYWSPGELAGYPVVYSTHRVSPENCDIAIATSDTSHVSILLNRMGSFEPREKGSCAILSQIAEAVLTTVRGQ
jgi:hypothetical protein